MDKSIVPIEESHLQSDSAASASRSLGSLIQIDSISIDLSNAMEAIDSPAVHEHFSIRRMSHPGCSLMQYQSGGFVAGMRKNNLKICLPFASEGIADDLRESLPPLYVPNFRWWQCVDCVPDILSESALKTVVAGRDDMRTSSSQNVEGEKDGLSLLENTGKKHERREYGDREDNVPVNAITNSKTCSTGSKDKTDGANPCSDEAEINPFQIRERNNSSADVSDMSPVAELPSHRVDEPENASSGSDGTPSVLPHRRKPKLRSLADIMVEERNPPCENSRPKSALSGGFQAISTEEIVLGPQPQRDVPIDVAKGLRSTQAKRKIALEEERGGLCTAYPSGTAKKLKGLMQDAEKSSRRVDILESESERDSSAQLNSRLVAKTHLIKPKKSKILGVSKKIRQTQNNGSAPVKEMPKLNPVCSPNLQKRPASVETSFGKLGQAPPALGEMGPYFGSYLSGLQMERMSTLSKSTRPEVEANFNPLLPPGKSNMKGKVALDLSLNSLSDAERDSSDQSSSGQDRGIPDLNETFSQKVPTMRGKQMPTLSEKRTLPLQHYMDISGSCNKEKIIEGKRKFGFLEHQTVQKTNDREHCGPVGASEDIPMDIVELLAKNQLERELGKSRTHLVSNGIFDSTRSPALHVDGRPEMIGFPLANRRNGVTVTNGKLGVGQNVPIHMPRLNMYSSGMGKLEESQFNLFGSFTQSQQRKTQYSASSSIMTGPRLNGGADLVWPPRRENVPFNLCVPQNRNSSIQTNNIGVPSFSDKCHKGKTISDIKGREEKRTVTDACLLKEGRSGSNSTSVGSLDPYSNEAIPAMQLLSLMDRGFVSGSSLKVGPKSFLDKTLSPCDHHPRTNENENQNFLNGPFFSQTTHSTYFPRLRHGASSSGEKKAPSYSQGQILVQQRNSKGIHLEGANNLITRPIRSNSPLGVCTLNRNPADFSIPDAKNEFTISAKDLRPKKRKALKEKSRSVNMVGQKRPRVRKDATRKEYSKK